MGLRRRQGGVEVLVRLPGSQDVDDGRLSEEQPGVLWNPVGGERVYVSPVDDEEIDLIADTLGLRDDPELDDYEAAQRDEAFIWGVVERHCDIPEGASFLERLTAVNAYFGSEQFLDDLTNDATA